MTQMPFPQTVTWHLIQYTPDMRRRESRNVGLAATDGAGWVVRMLGVATSGMIDAKVLRRLNLARSDYEPWVRYYTETLEDGGIERVTTSQRRRPGEFRVIPGGDDELSGSLDDCADRLFAELVEDGLRAV